MLIDLARTTRLEQCRNALFSGVDKVSANGKFEESFATFDGTFSITLSVDEVYSKWRRATLEMNGSVTMPESDTIAVADTPDPLQTGPSTRPSGDAIWAAHAGQPAVSDVNPVATSPENPSGQR
ncbi:hypothetical protein [Mycobacterium sp. URHB0021]